MKLFAKTEGSRPRLACEISTAGVVAARSLAPEGPVSAVAYAPLAPGAVVPSLKPGNVADRVAVIAALRRALEGVGARPNARGASLTMIIPDGAVRVLLLDFDSLPPKLTDALPLVRFRLKKLVPFDTDEAMVSYQVMNNSRGAVRVLAVAVPRDVLSDYETAAREAGFEPGAVLPSTLAALATLTEREGPFLAVNVYPTAVTTAIVRNGTLMLHRTVDLAESAAATPAGLPAALFGASATTEPSSSAQAGVLLPLIDREDSAEEWAAQEPLPEFGRNPYGDSLSAEGAVQNEDALTGLPPHTFSVAATAPTSSGLPSDFVTEDFMGREAATVGHSPYASAALTDELRSEIHNSFNTLAPPPGAPGYAAPHYETSGYEVPLEEGSLARLQELSEDFSEESSVPVHTLAPDVQAEEIARAISVAVAYFEDVLSAPPTILLSAGPLGADQLDRTLAAQGLLQELGIGSRELVEPAMLAAGAITATVPRSLLAGVAGALRG